MTANCTNCQKSFNIKPEFYGKKVKCKCGQVLVLQAPAAPPVAAPQPQTRQPAAASPSIKFQCGSCNRTFKLAASAAGKIAKCSCGAKNKIPAAQHAPATVSAVPPVAPNQPSDSSFGDDAFGDDLFSDSAFGHQHTNSQISTLARPQSSLTLPGYQKPKPAPKLQQKKKKKKTVQPQPASDFDWMALAQIGGGVLLLLVAFFIGSGVFSGELRPRSMKAVIFIGILGIGAIGKGIISAVDSI